MSEFSIASTRLAQVTDRLKTLGRDESGAAMAEYAVLVALVVGIAAAVLGTNGSFKNSMSTAFTQVGNKITTNAQ